MFSTWWPLLLVVASSVGYQVGLKEVSGIRDPMASLTVTYLAASVVSFVIYFFQSLGKESFLRGVLSVNASAIGLGLAIVGIEVGTLFMYRAGWAVNVAFVVANSLIVAALMLTGFLLYKEKLTLRQLIGVGISLAGILCIVMG
ncbi:MAG: EamA family transporter [Dialister sp.]|nr:EamA family transporter [Dialister sp.]